MDIKKAEIPAVRFADLADTPSTPEANYQIMYIREGVLYRQGEDGIEVSIETNFPNRMGARFTFSSIEIFDDTPMIVDWQTADWNEPLDYWPGAPTPTIPTGFGGLYLLDVFVAFNYTAVGIRGISIYVNTVFHSASFNLGGAGGFMYNGLLNLAEEDQITVELYQDSGESFIMNNGRLTLQYLAKEVS